MIASVPPSELLKARLRVVIDTLERGRAMLSDDGSDERLPDTVRNPLRDLLGEQQVEADRIVRRLDGPASKLDWMAAGNVRDDAGGLLREALDCLAASLVRGSALDGGLCKVADRLLQSLAAKTRVTWLGAAIVGGDERFARRSQLVHLRFPEFNLWALPLAAHEFGHLAAQNLQRLSPSGTTVFPIKDELDRTGSESEHYGELFADAFATWALGPAYACTSVLLRFRPDRERDDEGSSHPPDAKRVGLTLGLLDHLSREADPIARPYHQVLETLRRTWAAAEQAAGIDGSDADGELLLWREQVIVPLLARLVPDARYGGWGEALQIARLLANDDQLPDSEAPLVEDVLNAAWLARLEHWQDVALIERIEHRARVLLQPQHVPEGRS